MWSRFPGWHQKHHRFPEKWKTQLSYLDILISSIMLSGNTMGSRTFQILSFGIMRIYKSSSGIHETGFLQVAGCANWLCCEIRFILNFAKLITIKKINERGDHHFQRRADCCTIVGSPNHAMKGTMATHSACIYRNGSTTHSTKCQLFIVVELVTRSRFSNASGTHHNCEQIRQNKSRWCTSKLFFWNAGRNGRQLKTYPKIVCW